MLFATAAPGTEDILADELRTLGFGNVVERSSGVSFAPSSEHDRGDRVLAGMRACLHSRTALRVLLALMDVRVRNPDELYARVMDVGWEDWLDVDHTFAIAATTSAAAPFGHAPFLGQRVKDGVVDRLRARLGRRPDVERRDPDVPLYVHAEPAQSPSHHPGAGLLTRVVAGLDFAGTSLHARGYRARGGGPAPLRETLAAAMLALTEWSRDGEITRPLGDPMCGAGTLAIEAALVACRIAPGRACPRRRFAFERWPGFRATWSSAWQTLCEQADAQVLPRAPVDIFASDRDAAAISLARRNAHAAHASVAASLRFAIADVRSLTPLRPPGVIVSNPPYGQRLGQPDAGLFGFYRELGVKLRELDGHTAYLLCGSNEIQKQLRLAPTWTRKLHNGPLEALLCRFDLGRGSVPPPKRRPARAHAE